MQRFRWIALQGSSRGLAPPLLLFVLLIITSGIPALAADVSAACSSPVARVVSIQGSIELLRARQNDWSKVTRLDTPLCEGDRLRTGALSRAALFIQPETLVRVDQNTTIAVSQSAEETVVEFTQEDLVPASTAAHTCGAGYFITRFPRKFRVNTPHLNAAVEGTEFLVAMRCEATELSVFEGKVLAASAGSNDFPSQSVVSGQTLTVGGSEPPAIKLQLKPADAVQWTLYYPPITPAGAVPAEDCRAVAQDNRVSCLIARAENLLRAGRVEEAQANIGDALAIAPYSSDAKALSSVISLVRNDKAEALRLAREAVEATANSAPAWLALSYAQQADFKLEAALTSATRAAELTPSSALAFARVAELQLSLGWTREAEKTAQQAVAANPSESRAHMIFGFVHLAQIKVKEAREDFGRAIESDSTEPLSRLGLGLAIIREGSLVEGREQIEIAVALDPTNSLIRSYVGKAYYEENSKERDKLAASQFGIAKKLDPKDPTPWFYDAILKQTQNQPVEALQELQKSVELNDGRAVYRSKLLLDEDLGTRGVSLAEIYQDLGFDRLAVLEATKSVALDPGSYSAHRFLAQAYDKEPRSDIARESEYLQSQLRQPILRLPISAFRAQTNPFSGFLPSSGPFRGFGLFRPGLNEFTSLFGESGAGAYLDGLIGGAETNYGQAAASIVGDHFAFDFAAGHFQTAGFEANRDFQENSYAAFLQAKASPELSLQLEHDGSRTKRGDFFFPFDPTNIVPIRLDENGQITRIGARYEFRPQSDLLLSVISQSFDLDFTLPQFDITSQFKSDATSAELQYTWSNQGLSIVTGAGAMSGERFFVGGDPPPSATYGDGYIYAYLRDNSRRFQLQLGASTDSYREGEQELNVVCPKLGLILVPVGGTTLRAAAFCSAKRPFIASQTIEPTQIAGFNQFFDDIDGSKSRRYGAALDQRLPHGIAVGVEASKRNIVVPSVLGHFTWNEDQGRAYFYLPIGRQTDSSFLGAWSWAFTAAYETEHLRRPEEETGFEGIVKLNTDNVPLRVTAFHGSGLSVQLSTTHVSQSGRQQVDIGQASFGVDSRFWVTDLAIGFRLPGRRGNVSAGVMNLFDEQFDYVDSDPSNPRFARGRVGFLRLTLQL